MHTIDRRKVLTVVAAVPVAVGLAAMPALALAREDRYARIKRLTAELE